MTDQDGHNVNVVYGFFRMLMKIFQEKPDYFVITWDSPVKTLRHEEYPEYKANRKKMDDDFKHQIPITKDIVDQLWIPSLIVPTYEADDIIYTLAMKYKADKTMMIDIYSWDKDLKQLLDVNVFCVDSIGVKDKTTFDSVEVGGLQITFWMEEEDLERRIDGVFSILFEEMFKNMSKKIN